ncbi:VanZ family protein [Miniphocaeibacter halophilus]|uniref:VanZ family protein n=1 Tax=Miniphocaeibacter halophilus TaxID=2931922 RepID=A0AC61MZ81_9FIRM|nr:VanZ family protein [Miniphocaeibacter halophilus]QQK08509.1 VanZ family protein [Miniphocaeibacter halophilus]
MREKIGKIFQLFVTGLIILTLFLIFKIIISDFEYIVDFKKLILIGACSGVFNILSSLCYIRSLKNKSDKFMLVRQNITILFIQYLLILIIAIFLKKGMGLFYDTDDFVLYIKNNYNLKPFAIIKYYILGFNNKVLSFSNMFYNIFGNLIIFMPFGFFIYILFDNMKEFKNYFITMSIIIIFIEIMQVLTMTGFMDIDDYILNITGAIITYLFLNNKTIKNILKKFYIIK